MPGKNGKKISANVYSLGVVSFLSDVSSEMIFPLLPLFITTVLGAGKELLGLIEGVADSVASLVEIFSGYFSDVSGKRKQFVVAGYGLSSLMKAGIALSTAWPQVLLFRGLERIGKGLRTAPRDAIIAASTGKEVRGKSFGLHRAMDTLGAVVGPLLAYFLLQFLGESAGVYREVFFAALIPAFLAVLVLALFVREPAARAVAKSKAKIGFWLSLRQASAIPAYRKYLLISALFSLAYFSFAFFIVRAAELGVKPEEVLLYYVFYNILYAAASIPAGSLSDKIGRLPVIAGAFALYGIVCVGFAFASAPWHALLLFGLYGIFVAADESVNKAFITDLFPGNRRGMALGAYNTAIGALYLPASLLAGALYAGWGAAAAFGFAALLAFASAIALPLLVRSS